MTRTVLLCLVVMLAAVVPARADSDDEQAQRYFAAGNQAYEAGLYLAAAQAYQEAYAYSPLPAIAFSIGQAYRRQYYVDGDPERLRSALAMYRRYLDDVPQGGRRAHAVTHIATITELLAREDARTAEERAPAAPETQILVTAQAPLATVSIDGGEPILLPALSDLTPGKHRLRVEAPGHEPANLESLAVEGRLVVAPVDLVARPAVLAMRAPAGARVVVDGRYIGETPLTRLDVAPGEHEVVVTRRGRRSFSARVAVAQGETINVEVALPLTPRRVASRWIFGAAGALLAAGGATTVLAFSEQADAGRRLRDLASEEDRVGYERARASRDDLRAASYLLFAGALVAGATGAYLHVFDDGGGAGYRGSF